MERIMDEIDLRGWSVIVGGIESPLAQAAQRAGATALMELSVTDVDILNQVDARAVQFAEERAAEMVGMKFVGDRLVENPNPRWAITDSTREMLREEVTRGVKEGFSTDKIARQIEESYAFSKDRAKVISQTEIARAHVHGNIEGWKASGVVSGKRSILASNHDQDDECDGNADIGEVDLEELFPSGDMAPPYHPNCFCDVVAVLAEEGK